ncbi:MAG: N-acetylmuramoyl-L-alanine amidase [Candidatus Sericytochromatia bacterium]|nr:N-acetylmuramoyl-L-alanine amidase [Candidatus Sericytochromatia bacterium]
MTGFSLSAQAQMPLRLNAIQGVQFNRQAQILTLTSSEQLAPQIQYLKADYPGKIVLDIPNAVFPQVHQEIQAASQAINRIRISQFRNDPPTVRMVLDLQKPMEVNVRGRWQGSRYETRIEPVQASPEADPAVGVSGQQRLIQVRRMGQNLLLEGNAPLYPEIRRVGQSRLDYILTFYDVSTSLTGSLPQLRSDLIAAASVSQDAQGVQMRLKLTRDDLELIPFSKDNVCTLQLMVKANEQNLVRFEDLQVDELDRQTTRLRLYANDAFDFQVYPLEAPPRLVIDTLGTVLGQAGLERKLRSSQNLKGIRFLPQGDTQTDVRVILDLHGDVHYQFDWQGKYLEVLVQAKVQRAPVLTPENRHALVVIDAGHGGNDPGAIGVSKQKEKQVTLEVSRLLQRYLENDGIQVIMTRAEDVEVLLQPRVDAANLRSADVFVSIHANSMPPGNTHVRGIETYYTTPQSKVFADTLHRYMVTQLGAVDRRVRQRGLFVTRKATMPSVLLEIGFLSSPEEDALLSNPNYQRKVAKAIRDGIHDYLTRHQKLKPQI